MSSFRLICNAPLYKHKWSVTRGFLFIYLFIFLKPLTGEGLTLNQRAQGHQPVTEL